jgi:formyl-CoA transferase
LAGLFATIGALMALLHRERSRTNAGAAPTLSAGQVVDVALYESIFAVMESLVPDYDAYGLIKHRTGSVLSGIAPTNIYPCRHNKWVVIGGNGDAIFKRLMQAIGRADMAHDPRFAANPGRWEHHEEIDQAIAAWTHERTIDEVMAVMLQATVPAGPILDAADITEDAQFAARQMLETHAVPVDGDAPVEVRFPAVVPKLEGTPGGTRWLGPELGEHNDEIYRSVLDLAPEQINQLRQAGVI